jgi:hypothetical protein
MFAAHSSVAVFLSVLLLSIWLPVPAQSRPVDLRPRLVSVAEGEAIVQAAWELRRGMNPKPDCSHFVHAAYTRAGFLYEFAGSREVFAGIPGFLRVRNPQAGDLVVWQGHIGIVIDPRGHSFYSSVLSGFAIENYQSNYWIKRGNPRFYRFLVNGWQNAPRPALSNLAQTRPASNPVLSKVIQTPPASGKPTALMVKARPQAPGLQSARIEAAANPSPQIKTQPSAQTKAKAPSQISAKASVQIQAPASAQMKPEASGQRKAEASGQMKLEATDIATSNADIHDEVLVTSRPTPSRSEVLDAINRSADNNGERLLQNRLLDSQPSVGVVDRFTIVSLDFQGNVGLADLEIKEIAVFRYGTAKPYRLTTLKRVILSRQKQGWILLDPQNLVYLNRRLAARALSHQLATMPQGPTGQQQVRTATKILRELLSADAGGSD